MLALPLALKHAWEFARRYAWAFFAAIAGFLGWILLRRVPSESGEAVLQAEKRRREEIERAREAERVLTERLGANEAALREALSKVDEEYRDRIMSLDEESRNKAATIVSQHGDDPDKLAEILASTFGFVSKKP